MKRSRTTRSDREADPASALSLEELQKIAVQEALDAAARPARKSAYGLLAKYGPGPTEEEIDENRKDMFRALAADGP
jgi:hypothetical protein